MADALEPEDAEDRKLRERLAGRVGRQVQGVACPSGNARRLDLVGGDGGG